MGVIQRQGIKHAIVTYIGLVLGAVNLLWIYPKFLTAGEFGLYKFLSNTAQLIQPFAVFGAVPVIIKFFPNFKNEKNGHNGFLTLLLLVASIGLFFTEITLWLFQDSIERYYADKSSVLNNFMIYFYPLLLFTGYNYLLTAYASNFKRIVIPNFFNNLFLKAASGGLCFLIYYNLLSFEGFLTGFVLINGLISIALLVYIASLGQLQFGLKLDFIDWKLFRSMSTFAAFGILGGLGSVIAIQIDMFMVGTLIDIKSVATYSIGFFIADVIDIPKKSLDKIVGPVLSEAWEKNDRAQVLELYQKTALNQFIIGVFILICIWISVDQLFLIMPNGEKYNKGIEVIFILALGKIFDLATGSNDYVIGYSPFYRFNFYAILCLAVLNIISNLIFIPMFNINGAALATTFSLLIFNLLKVVYIYLKLNMFPFSRKFLWVLLISVSTFLIVYLIPDTGYPLINIILNSIGVTIVFWSAILGAGISEDIQQLVAKGWFFVKRKL